MRLYTYVFLTFHEEVTLSVTHDKISLLILKISLYSYTCVVIYLINIHNIIKYHKEIQYNTYNFLFHKTEFNETINYYLTTVYS